MENKKNSEFKESFKIVGGALKSSMKKHKLLWSLGIIIVVLIIAVSVFSAVVSTENLTAKAMDILMPEYLPPRDENDPIQFNFYKELNEDYINSDTKIEGDNYIEIFKYYYLDENGEKQYVDDGIYRYTDDEGNEQICYVGIGFMYSMGQKVSQIKEIAKTVAWVLVAVLVVFLIVLWYIKDKKRNEQNKPKRIRKAENKNQ